ncbi:MAG: ferrous iron transporter B [Acidobacteria bacterium]|nr:ferrous iron transporter B [Acidobacteriota bacterium]
MSLAAPQRAQAAVSAASALPATPRIALVGAPNTGKTTLFNRLCGLRAKTANFPGTTTDARIGRFRLTDRRADSAEIVDLPGTYRLFLELPEARICRGVLLGEGVYRQPDAVVVVADATNLGRSLYLVGELLSVGLPTVVALNMVDLAQRRGLSLDPIRLGQLLGCPVVPVVARSGSGIDELRLTLAGALAAPPLPPELPVPDPADDPAFLAWADEVVEQSVGGEGAVGAVGDTVSERLDQAFTHPVLGILLFAAVMAGLFWTVFALATVPMDLIDLTFQVLGQGVEAALPAGAVRDLLANGVIAGIAGTVVFLPQICLLFFLISLLEDTGYLARAAFVADRMLSRFGLPGHAFVPLLSSHACALPGILSTRLIPDRRDRLATILVAPFMSCSARLPVYVLLTSLLFRDRPLLAGLAFVGCYLLGGLAALITAFVARRTLLRGRSRAMVLELPSYKWPALRTAFLSAYQQGKSFLETAGTMIVAICIVMWWLSAYPRVEPPTEAISLRARASVVETADPARSAALRVEADGLEARHGRAYSFAGRIGRFAQPVYAPLGYDWQLTMGVLTSFLAREVFVSTMAVLLTGEAVDDPDEGVIARVRDAVRDDGTPLFTQATAASVLVFFVLAMQCLPTLVVTRREAGGWRWAALQFFWMTGLAWVLAFVTYQGLNLAGIS